MAGNQSKWAPLSLTVIGICVALAETVTGLGSEPLNALLGVGWGQKAIVIAGLVLAFVGRLRASKTLTWLPIFLAVFSVMIGGCSSAGQAARTNALSPWAVAAWKGTGDAIGVHELAERGIADMIDDGELSEGTAEFPRETVRLFGEAVDSLGGVR